MYHYTVSQDQGGNPEVWFRCAISANYNFVIIMCFLYNHYVSQYPQATGGILRWGEILAKRGECPPPLPPSPTSMKLWVYIQFKPLISVPTSLWRKKTLIRPGSHLTLHSYGWWFFTISFTSSRLPWLYTAIVATVKEENPYQICDHSELMQTPIVGYSCSLEYVIFTSCNLRALRRVILLVGVLKAV